MDEVDYNARLAELEAQELQAEEEPSDRLYAQLLALYILTDDLTSAKFLWKRIPPGMKSDNDDLKTIWTIAVNLIQRAPSPIYFLIEEREWPAHVKTIMSRIADRVRKQQIGLISSAYSDIRIDELTKLAGTGSEEETLKLVSEQGWSVDSASQTVRPCKGSRSPQSLDEDREMSQEQLHKLTEYVAFLENH